MLDTLSKKAPSVITLSRDEYRETDDLSREIGDALRDSVRAMNATDDLRDAGSALIATAATLFTFPLNELALADARRAVAKASSALAVLHGLRADHGAAS